MRKIHLLTFSLLLIPALAHAQDYQGLYTSETGQSLQLSLSSTGPDSYDLDLSTTVAMVGNQPGCGGSISGPITITDNQALLQVANEGYDPASPISLSNAKLCEISLSFDGEYTVQLEELGGCGYYHGAACSFTGAVIHDAAGL
ncbi:hypothetical protein [Ketogulonicigenium vulgare]|uniref:hypothetical protein n=1 Tax=Ketogulonicigenium vulgare TaxID=92945 RepID=UPI0023599084|nr:hypothetical protein [Ketogulonicigenium vulgare]